MKDSDILALAFGNDINNNDDNDDNDYNDNNIIPVKSSSKKWFKKNKVAVYNDTNDYTAANNNTTIKSRHHNIQISNDNNEHSDCKRKKKKKTCYRRMSIRIRKALTGFCLTCYDSKRVGTAYNEIPLLWPIIDWIRGMRLVLFSMKSHKSGMLFIILGLVLSMSLEIFPNTSRYNMVTISTLMASLEIWYFPQNTIRPQIVLCIVLIETIFVDIYHILGQLAGYHHITPFHIIIFIIIVMKLMALQVFLFQVRGSLKTRKYLIRRLRLFLVPLSKPRRMMREIRSRIMATAIIQAISVAGFSLLFVLSITVFDYSYHFLGSWGGWYLWKFLTVKIGSSLLVLLSILYDTDIVLFLAHFGCLNFFGEYVKKYINDKRNTLGGWPYPYYYNELRYQIVCFIKLLDFLWSIMGWLIIGRSLTPMNFFEMEDSFRVYVCLIVLFLLISDLWGGILFMSVRYLIQIHGVDVDKGKEFDDSDDSELDELEYRKNLNKSGNSNNDDSENDDDIDGLRLLQDVKRLVGDDQKYSRSQFYSRRINIQNPLHGNSNEQPSQIFTNNKNSKDQFVSPFRNK